MAQIDGGGMSFTSELDNDQLNKAIDESLKRIQGLSDGTVAGGEAMDAAFSATADSVREALSEIGKAVGIHEQELNKLETDYQVLGEKAAAAFMAGRDEEYVAIGRQQEAVRGEIVVRKNLIKELNEQSNKLEDNAAKLEENTNKQVSMRARIRELREEMMLLVDQGIDEQSEAYGRLQSELVRLLDIQDDINQQGRIMSHDEGAFQGLITGLSGLSGAFSAATGAVSLFSGENENLQKIMLKVQSLMAITIGLQQVAYTFNKDSAFQLVTMNKLRGWWNDALAKGAAVQTTETTATAANTAAKKAQAAATSQATTAETANTVATGAQATAATAGTAANLTLAGAFRVLGAAIKSIPVFGWILAGISGLVALVGAFTRKTREAKKEQEEFTASMVENAYKSIGAVESLSVKWDELGDNLDDKKKFVEDNKKAFDELGISVMDVVDAENLLVNNKQNFIDAQIAKAKAAVYLQQVTEKVKKQMELEAEIEKMSDTRLMYSGGGMFGSGTVYEVDNRAKIKKQKELEDLQAEIRTGYENAATEEKLGLDLLKDAGIDGVNEYAEGAVGAIEQAISLKQAYLKTLTNNDDYKAGVAEIEALQKQLEGITGKKKTSTTTVKDPFLEKLEKQKKEYDRFLKWVNSGDEILAKAANKEFEGLLAQGKTYIDYLKKQRDELLQVDIAERTKLQNAQLRTINDQIAEETKKTVLESFNNELAAQLTNAQTIMEMLNIIEQRRQQLANDGTDLDNEKKDALDEAEKDVVQKAKEETDALLDDYASYLERKIQMQEQFNNDILLLEKRRGEATTEEQRKEIDRVIANRRAQYERDAKSSGDVEYDDLLRSYATFEQEKQAIIDEYDAKRLKAQEHGNEQLIEQLNKAQAKALSSLALGEMQENPDWEKMFGNLDELTTTKLEEILAMIEGKTAFLGVEFDPKDLEAIKNKVEEIKSEIQQRNPFKTLIASIKDYSKAADEESKKKALSKTFESAAASIDLVSGALDSVLGGIDQMGIQMSDETQAVMANIGGIIDGASNLAQGLATGNPLAIIQGSISIISNGIDMIFGAHDRKAEREIKKHAEAVGKLESEYNALAWSIDKALGNNVYKQQQAAIANMEAQREHLRAMWEAEESKKKSDSSKVDEYRQQYEQLGRDIQDMLDEISNDLLQTDAKAFADKLGDALVNAFSKGEDAALAFGDTVDNVIKRAVLNQLKKNFLEKQLQGALDGLEKSMGYWDGDDFVFDGLTEAEIAAFKAQVANITKGFDQAMEAYADLFKDIAPDADTSLTGAVKGVSEETASLMAGQMNAIRINQMEATQLLRQSLVALTTIASNTSYNHHLSKLERIVTILEGGSNDTLRSQGLS
jgi:hypothetical protein